MLPTGRKNQQWVAIRQEFHTRFRSLDDAYQRSLASLQTKTVADKDEERDLYGQVLEQVSKQWSRLPDDALAIHGRRVYQVFRDIDYRSSEALVAQNEKVVNIVLCTLLCDIVARSGMMLPVNTITSLLGIPIIIYVVLRNSHRQ